MNETEFRSWLECLKAGFSSGLYIPTEKADSPAHRAFLVRLLGEMIESFDAITKEEHHAPVGPAEQADPPAVAEN